MSNGEILIQEVDGRQGLTTFIRFPWKVYREDPYWVPPLIKDYLHKFSPKHPFRSHSQMIFLLASRGGEMVGRISGIIDHNYIEYHKENVGFFGFFESLPDREVANRLLSEVKNWLKQKGMKRMIGPMNPSTNDECGLLVEGFNTIPSLMMPYNPSYYPAFMEELGMRKAIDLYAYSLDESFFVLDRLSRITERLKKREPHLTIRTLNMRHFDKELRIVRTLYNDAWRKNWGFVPMTDAEMDDIAKSLKPLVIPDLVLFAYLGDEPVGFSVSLPDYNVVLKHLNGKIGLLGIFKFLYYSRKIHTVRVMLLGVKRNFLRRGVEGLLYMESLKRGAQKGYVHSECSWILEDNLLMQHGIEAMGGKRSKTYRIYETSL